MEYPDNPDEFVELVASGNLNSDQLLEILRLHTHDITECETCEYIDENGPQTCFFDFIFESNKDLVNLEILEYLTENLISTNDNRFLIHGLMSEWSLHPKSSVNLLTDGAWNWGTDMLHNLGEGDSYSLEEIEDTLSKVAEHPSVTEELFKLWLENVHNPGPFVEPPLDGCTGVVDACPTCQDIFSRIWAGRN